MLLRLESVCAIGGRLLRVPVDCILFSLPNWMVGGRLVMSLGVQNLFSASCFPLTISYNCIVFCLPQGIIQKKSASGSWTLPFVILTKKCPFFRKWCYFNVLLGNTSPKVPFFLKIPDAALKF